MAEGEAGKGIGGFLKGSTGPLPNWAWGLVIVGGIAAAYFIPKFFGGGQGTSGQTSTDTGTSDQSGLGLAIDPTTGLPYAVEGLVPSGGTTGGTGYGSAPPPIPPVPPTPQPTPTPLPQQPPANTNLPLWQQLHVPGPIIPSGQYQGPSFSNLKPGTKYTYNGVTYTLTTSVANEPGSGMLYGIDPQGRTVALYGPPSAYRPQNILQPYTAQPTWPGGITQTRVGA